MQFLEISWDFVILGFSKILGFFQRFFGIFDEVYEDFQSNLPLACGPACGFGGALQPTVAVVLTMQLSSFK